MLSPTSTTRCDSNSPSPKFRARLPRALDGVGIWGRPGGGKFRARRHAHLPRFGAIVPEAKRSGREVRGEGLRYDHERPNGRPGNTPGSKWRMSPCAWRCVVRPQNNRSAMSRREVGRLRGIRKIRRLNKHYKKITALVYPSDNTMAIYLQEFLGMLDRSDFERPRKKAGYSFLTHPPILLD